MPRPSFRTVMVPITFYGRNIEELKISGKIILRGIKSWKNNNFLLISIQAVV